MFTTPDRRVMTLLLAGILALFTATPTQAAASATDIHVTNQGLQPSSAFAAVDAPVVWHNDTNAPIRLSDQPFTPEPAEDTPRLYLPSLSAPGRSLEAASPVAPAAVHWTSDPIAPGQVYTRTYDTPGEFNFYVSSLSGITGTVTVLANTSVGNELIDAEQGGSVQVDNVTLTVPPGSLAQDTVITLAHPDAFALGADGVEYVRLEPSGLTFAQSVTLTLTYTDSPDLDEDFLNAAVFDEATGDWTYDTIVAQDQAANTFSVQVSHFSWRLAYAEDPLYVVLKIPDKYLEPGDLLYNMDDSGKWLPGHAAIFTEPGSLVESNVNELVGMEPESCGQWWPPDPAAPLLNLAIGRKGGVQSIASSVMLDKPFYLGAMRHTGASDSVRRSASLTALAQTGKGYLVVGQGNISTRCFSCVGLAEYAYDQAGASIIDFGEFVPITPLQQFESKKLTPVNAITARVGEAIRIPVYAVIQGHVLLPTYRKGGTVTAADLPPGSAFAGGDFTWTPTAADGGKDYIVIFWAAGRVGINVNTECPPRNIHVAPSPQPPDAPTPTPTIITTPTPTFAGAPTPTPTATPTPTPTPTATNTPSPTPTSTNTPSPTPTATLSPGIRPIAAGGNHTCAVTVAGGVMCWGNNEYGQLGDGTTTSSTIPVVVTGLTSSVAAVAAGYNHTCVLTDSGGVQCWGYNYHGQLGDNTTTSSTIPVVVTGLNSDVVAIAAGSGHTCALTTSGGVMCWGDNGYGQLGDGTATSSTIPVAVEGLSSGVAAVAAGGAHTCALTDFGGVMCWGYNGDGQLGDGSFTTSRRTPVGVVGLADGVTAIIAGRDHTCASMSSGGIKCWGRNWYGQLGDGYTTSRPTPVNVVGLAGGVVAIAAGGLHTCAITSIGGVKCWGYNHNGQLGDGSTTSRTVPVDVEGLATGIATIAAMDDHTCAIISTGGIKCWGDNDYGQLGNGSTTNHTTPLEMVGLNHGVVAIAAGSYHTCVIISTGAVKCWGNNIYGQLGDGTTTSRTASAEVVGLTAGVVAIAAGNGHTCAVTSTGGVKCWGDNYYGQLGDGSRTGRKVPVDVVGLTSGVSVIAAGGDHTCAIMSSGGVKCWGDDDYGQLGDGTTTYRSTPVDVVGLTVGVVAIATGNGHTCAVASTGGVKCWGANYSGQLGDGSTTNRATPVDVVGLADGVVAIAAGGIFDLHDAHTCAATSTDEVKCWGANDSGQLGDGSTTNRSTPVDVVELTGEVAAIAAGGIHICAVTSAGGAKCWGDNIYGQLGDGTHTYRAAPVDVVDLTGGVATIAAGNYHTCVIMSSGEVKCWGGNRLGQLGVNPGWIPVDVIWP